MALPAGITPKTVTFGLGTFTNGDLVEGTVTITAPVNVLHVPTGSPIFSSTMSQKIVNGQATFDLCPTDHPDLNRRDWTYTLVVKINGALKQPDPIPFLLPVAGPDTVDLDSLVSVPSSAGTPVSVTVLTAGDLDPLTADYLADDASDTTGAVRTLVAADTADPASAIGVAQRAALVTRGEAILSILAPAFGVSTGTSSSQTSAISAAFAANVDKAFYFPPGDYRLDTTLNITTNNSLILAKGARIYAAAPMQYLINYDNGQSDPNLYAWDACLEGHGQLDAALNAQVALAIGSVLRFSLGAGITIIDPINRGILTKSLGAEIIGGDIRIYNTGTTNSGYSASVTTTSGSANITATAGTFSATDVGSPISGTGIPVGATISGFTSSSAVTLSASATASGTVTAAVLTNIAIEANMGDCQFSDIIIRDFTGGVWDKGNNVWSDVHPWIGTNAQLLVRYPISVGFILGSNSVLTRPYADTFRTQFRTRNPGRTASVTTTSGSATITTATSTFTIADVGSPISGAGIPTGTRITAVASGTSATISANATASATVTATILGNTKVQVTNPRAFVNTGNLDSTTSAANPGIVFDLQDGARLLALGGRYQGATTAYTFASGSTAKLEVRGAIDDVPGSVTGLGEYRRGVQLGTFSFGANMFGSTTGSATLTTNQTTVEVRDGYAMYRFVLVGTLPSNWAGKMRIGIPTAGWPTGATAVSTGVGSVSFATGPDINVMLGANASTPGQQVVLLEKVSGGATTEPDTTALANTTVQVWGFITCPFTYPS